MRGMNEFKFNQATMVDAAQYYLEKIMKAPVPKVTSVTSKNDGIYTDFIIKVEEKDNGSDQKA